MQTPTDRPRKDGIDYNRDVRFCLLLCALMAGGSLAAQSSQQSPSAEIGGVITDEFGMPIPGATISLDSDSGSAVETTSGSSGQFLLEALRPGSYRMQAAFPGFQIETRQVELLPDDSLYTEIELSIADIGLFDEIVEGEISGTVRDANGRPVPGAVVWLRPMWSSKTTALNVTDDQGRYALSVRFTGQLALQVRTISDLSAIVLFQLVALPIEEPRVIDVTLP